MERSDLVAETSASTFDFFLRNKRQEWEGSTGRR